MTVCVRDRRCLLGPVDRGVVQLSTTGRTVAGALAGVGSFHPGVGLAVSVVMPNHVHAIVFLDRARFRPPPVPAVVGAFKARASRWTGVGPDLYKASQDAARAMIDHLAETSGLSREDAYVLSSLCVDLKISEIVDAGQYIVSALLPLAVSRS